METKNAQNSTIDVDDKSRRVKVAISDMGSLDQDNDIIEKGAYDKTIRERGPQGKNLVWLLKDHDAKIGSAIAKFSQLYVEGTKLIGVADIPHTTLGNDMLEMYKSGHINNHSVGFQPIKTSNEKSAGKPYRSIKEIKLFEGSAVCFGANENTPTLSVGKSGHLGSIAVWKEMIDGIEALEEMKKQGKLPDDISSLFEIKCEQLKFQIKNVWFATQPHPSTEPEQENEIVAQLKSMNQLFSTKQPAAARSESQALIGRMLTRFR